MKEKYKSNDTNVPNEGYVGVYDKEEGTFSMSSLEEVWPGYAESQHYEEDRFDGLQRQLEDRYKRDDMQRRQRPNRSQRR